MLKTIDLVRYGTKLLSGNNIPDSSRETQILLSYLLDCTQTELFLNYDKNVSGKIEKLFKRKLQKRINRIPLSYIIGWCEFAGLKFKLKRGVFIPRPETELLVEACFTIPPHAVLSYDKTRRGGFQLPLRQLTILDIGTGCGNVAISLAKFLYQAHVVGIDISEEAIELAGKNAKLNQVNDRVFFIKRDLFQLLCPLSTSDPLIPYDIVISNPPYVSSEEFEYLQPEILYEPKEALDGGFDGLQFYRQIADVSKEYLKPSGYLIVEVGYNQSEKVKDIFQLNGVEIVKVVKDYLGYNRVIVAQRHG